MAARKALDAMTSPPDPKSPEVRPPFSRHRIYYVVLKYIVLLVAAYLALRLLRGFWS